MSIPITRSNAPSHASDNAMAPDPVPTFDRDSARRGPDVVKNEIYHQLGLRSRDQHARVDRQREVPERGLAHRVRQRHTAGAAIGGAAHAPRGGLRERRVGVGGHPPPGVTQDRAEQLLRLPAGIVLGDEADALRDLGREGANARLSETHRHPRSPSPSSSPSPRRSSTLAIFRASTRSSTSPSTMRSSSPYRSSPMRWSVTRFWGKL